MHQDIETQNLEVVTRLPIMTDSQRMEDNRNPAIYEIWESFKDLPQQTHIHSVGVALISWMIGQRMIETGLSTNYPEFDANKLCLCGLLHDTGKLHVLVAPLMKDKVSDTTTLDAIKIRHVEMGPERLEFYGFSQEVKTVARQHHMAHNDTVCSYPTREQGEKIHIYSSIVRIADMLEAMTSSNRKYQDTLTLDQAKTCILNKFDDGQLNPQLKKVFEAVYADFTKTFPLPTEVILERVNKELGLCLTI